MDVVILAGGLGRRFGGVKQFVPVAPDGATLLEVTVRDAVRAGCTRAVIVTALGHEDDARALFAARPVAGCTVVTVTQRPDDLPGPAPARAKPWGTAHAVWAARHAVHGPFLLFNADDSYGPGAPAALAAALAPGVPGRFAMLGYALGATLSPAGTVSRAVAEVDGDGLMTGLREFPAVGPGGRVVGGADDGVLLPMGAPVSMNAWAFTPDVFPLIEAFLVRFLATADLAHDEAFLPAAIDAAVRAGEVTVQVAAAPDPWCGMTWPEDRAKVAARLAELASVEAAGQAFGLADAAPQAFGGGLIHGTWRVGGHLLQRINTAAFPDPPAVVRNAALAAARVDAALRASGDDDPRHRLRYLPAPGGASWYRGSEGAVWRCAVLVPNARSADPAKPAELRSAARALGRFPGLVAAGEGPAPATVLPGFHDTPARLTAFRAALQADAAGRVADCGREATRLLELAPLAQRLADRNLPERLVHNDAKPDNVLVDAATGEALCVIDLDTVQPGLAVHDFGDLVRGAVTGRPEDEPDAGAIGVDRDRFTALAAGWCEGAATWLTSAERAAMVDGALVITYEQALRFLADHLAGDVYYRVDDPGHNLRRARAQLALLEALLEAEDELCAIVEAL